MRRPWRCAGAGGLASILGRGRFLHSECQQQGEAARGLKCAVECVISAPDVDVAACGRVLKLCGEMRALPEGRRVHSVMIKHEIESDSFLSGKLLDMYLKCGSFGDAKDVFSRMPCRGVISWTRMIGASIQEGYAEEALCLFWQMQKDGIKPDELTFVTILNACSSPASLQQGMSIHRSISEKRCGSLEQAREVFNRMLYRDSASWNTMISSYDEDLKGAFCLFRTMLVQGTVPNRITYVTILDTCGEAGHLSKGREIHSCILNSGLESDSFVGTALVNMYGRCGQLDEAARVFCRILEKDVILWTSMVAAYAQQELAQEALHVFRTMQLQGFRPNKITCIILLKACSSETYVQVVDQIHTLSVDNGFISDSIVRTALINCYGRTSKLPEACSIFDTYYDSDLFLWNTMLAAYAEHGEAEDALHLFRRLQLEGLKADRVTLTNMASVCCSLSDAGRIHQCCRDHGYLSDAIAANSILSMYVNCGSLGEAISVFQQMQQKDVVAWSVIIAGHFEEGLRSEGMHLFRRMQLEGTKPNKVTAVAMVNTSSATPLEEAKRIHSCIMQTGLEVNTMVANAIVDMYGKCGCAEEAVKIFDRLANKDIVSWSALISALSQHGLVDQVHKRLFQMQQEGFRPNDTTFVSVFSAYSHAGTLQDACQSFSCLSGDYGITLTSQHYGCIIDLLGRAGWLAKAETVMSGMPFPPTVVILKSLLGACKTHCDLERAQRIAELATKLDSKASSTGVLLSSIYASS